MRFRLEKEDEIKIEVMDKGMIMDDLVGESSYFLDEVKVKKRVSEQVKIAYKGKEAGVVL